MNAPTPPRPDEALIFDLMQGALPWIDSAYAKPADPDETPFHFTRYNMEVAYRRGIEVALASRAEEIAALREAVNDQIGWLETVIAGTRFTKPEAGRVVLLLERVEQRLSALRAARALTPGEGGNG